EAAQRLGQAVLGQREVCEALRAALPPGDADHADLFEHRRDQYQKRRGRVSRACHGRIREEIAAGQPPCGSGSRLDSRSYRSSDVGAAVQPRPLLLCSTAMSIEFHRRMLADRVRYDAFREAFARTIVPGRTTVADIGAGTGILAFLARELNATDIWL